MKPSITVILLFVIASFTYSCKKGNNQAATAPQLERVKTTFTNVTWSRMHVVNDVSKKITSMTDSANGVLITTSNAVQALKELKTKPGKDIVLWGSISLAQSLMRAGLIDEYHLRICPTVLGSGRPLFESTGPMDFELYGSKVYKSGLVLLQYRQVQSGV
jgi:dihydrofolate reductase